MSLTRTPPEVILRVHHTALCVVLRALILIDSNTQVQETEVVWSTFASTMGYATYSDGEDIDRGLLAVLDTYDEACGTV